MNKQVNTEEEIVEGDFESELIREENKIISELLQSRIARLKPSGRLKGARLRHRTA